MKNNHAGNSLGNQYSDRWKKKNQNIYKQSSGGTEYGDSSSRADKEFICIIRERRRRRDVASSAYFNHLYLLPFLQICGQETEFVWLTVFPQLKRSESKGFELKKCYFLQVFKVSNFFELQNPVFLKP